MQGRIAQWIALTLLVAVGQTAPLHAQEQTRRIRLSRDTVVAGVRCAPTGRAYAELYSNGGLVECPLAADSIVEGHALPKGTWIRLHQDRGLDGAWLPRNTELQGLPCKGTGYKGGDVCAGAHRVHTSNAIPERPPPGLSPRGARHARRCVAETGSSHSRDGERRCGAVSQRVVGVIELLTVGGGSARARWVERSSVGR